jgi:hypothetical protein
MMVLMRLVVIPRVIFVIGKSVGFLILGVAGEVGFFENIYIENGILYIHIYIKFCRY